MLVLSLPTPGYARDIPILMDVVDVNISDLLGLDVLDGNNLFVDSVIGHLWNQIITYKSSRNSKVDGGPNSSRKVNIYMYL